MGKYEATPMHDEATRVQVEQVDSAVIELRYFETPGGNGYRSWKLTVNEAADLAAWWTSQGKHARRRHLPIRQLGVGCLKVSMGALETVLVRGTGACDRLKCHDYLLPRKVVELLSRRMADKQQLEAPGTHEVAETCSKEP